MAHKKAHRSYQMFRSPGYEKTITDSECQTWNSPAAAARQLWPQCVFKSERTGRWYLQRYNFPVLVVELMLGGELVYDVGGMRQLSCEGEIHLTPAGSDVRVESTERGYCKRIGIELRGKLVATLAQSLRLTEPVNLLPGNFPAIDRNLRAIFSLLEEKKRGTEPKISALCYDTLLRLSTEIENENDDAFPQPLRALLDIIHANLHQPLSGSELAQMAACSPSTLTRLFQKHLKQTPQAYVNQCRLQQAQQLLLTQELSVKQVAAMMGFKNQFYFSRAFKKEFGRPPTEVRQMT